MLRPSSAPLTRAIVVANVAVAAVSALCFFLGWPDVLREVMPLSLEGLREGKLWQIFTYMWIHAQFVGAGPLHLLFNMMTLAPFARVVEQALGLRRLALVYGLGGMLGAVFYVIEAFGRDSTGGASLGGGGVVGASAAVLAVVTLFAHMHPNAPLTLFLVPVRVRAIRAVQGFALLSVILLFVPALDFVAHGAHLGGMLGGWWCARKFLRPPRHPFPPRLAPDQSPPAEVMERVEVEMLTPEALVVESDRVLEQISRHGMGSLTERDRAILRRLRERI